MSEGPARKKSVPIRWPSKTHGVFASRDIRPTRPRELRWLMEDVLNRLAYPVDEYAKGKFSIQIYDLQFSVLANKQQFPWIRIHHAVIEDVPADERADHIAFSNSLQGRSSTNGSHWWLGETTLWQVMEHHAAKFDEEIFLNQFDQFVAVARDRTPEIRARFNGSWPRLDEQDDQRQ